MRCNILAYADDLVLLAHNASAMNTLYGKLCTSINDTKLLMNNNKTKCMIFSDVKDNS